MYPDVKKKKKTSEYNEPLITTDSQQMKYMQEICREAICETCWPLHLYKSAFVLPERKGCKQRVVFSLGLSPVLASAMIKINVRSRCHCWILSSSFSSSRFKDIWIKWMTTVGHVCVSASQRSLGNRSSSPLSLSSELRGCMLLQLPF